MAKNLLSTPSLVEAPFIIAKIGEYSFGVASRKLKSQNSLNVTYPNYMDSIQITKINGAVNTYTLSIKYQVANGDDPNLIEKILSSVSKTRRITLSYGDWNSPNYIYAEEEAIITGVTTSSNFSSSQISYTINCTSDSLKLLSNKSSYPARYDKPSNVLLGMLRDKASGIQDVFKGMRNQAKVLSSNLIASDDRQVQIPAQTSISTLDYMKFLVNNMVPSAGVAKYFLTAVDDVLGKMGGQFFKVTKVDPSAYSKNSLETYEIDVGYPGNNFVTSFSVNNQDAWSILYNESETQPQDSYTYTIDNNGDVIQNKSVSIARSSTTLKATTASQNWWTQMTQFPITAEITIRGLTRPAILMEYVRLNVMFYGQKHISSGLYIITKQVDRISSSGYTTTLSLLRIREDA